MRVVCFVVLLLVLHSAHAEDIESVVVSASSLGVDKTSAPITISVVDANELKNIAATHPNEIAARVPGAWVSRGDGQEHLSAIRSPVFTGPGACGAFIIAEDSIPVRAPGFCNVNQLFDTHYESAKAIEVFRGPSSTVFGSNGLFGGINVVSPDADAQNHIQAELGSFRFKRLQYAVTDFEKIWQSYATFTDTESFRADAGYTQQKVGFKLYSGFNGWESESSVQLNNLEQETAGFIAGADAYLDEHLRTQNVFPEAYRDAKSLRAYSRWEYDSESSFWLIQPHLRIHKMEFLMHFVPWQPTEKNQHHSLGLKVVRQSKWGAALSFAQGIDIDITEGELNETQEALAPFSQENFPVGVHYDYAVQSISVSPYLELDYFVSSRFSLNTQLRWESVNYDYENRTSDGSACDSSASACRFFRPASRQDRFDSPSWRLGAVYRLNDTVSFFANLASAYRAPQTAELYRTQSPNQVGLDAVRLNGLDIGFRQLSGFVQYELNVYSMTQHDAIYQDSNRAYLVGAESSHQGIEYHIVVNIAPSLSVSIFGTYAEHRYENSPDLLGVELDIAGNDVDTAPTLLRGANINWHYRNGSLDVSWVSVGEYYLEPENQHEYEGHDLLGLSWSHRFAQDFEFRLTANNLLDEQYAERADFAFGEYRYFPGADRSFRLSMRHSF